MYHQVTRWHLPGLELQTSVPLYPVGSQCSLVAFPNYVFPPPFLTLTLQEIPSETDSMDRQWSLLATEETLVSLAY